MKVIFIASPYNKKSHQFNYLAIIDLLESLGNQVFHHYLTELELQQVIASQTENNHFHNQILQTLKTADLVVAEVTSSSTAVGYFLSEALNKQKPVLALTTQREPPLTTFLEADQNLVVYHYSKIRELEQKLPFLLAQLETKKHKRFNLFLTHQLDQYLTDASQKIDLSKSEYLRRLLKKDQNSRL
ncbi:MAG: hypothetical protein ABII10_01065 [Candidatus Paceibacterota bacterium]